jgi:hypothetical protein
MNHCGGGPATDNFDAFAALRIGWKSIKRRIGFPHTLAMHRRGHTARGPYAPTPKWRATWAKATLKAKPVLNAAEVAAVNYFWR